jgi:alkylation response protein AidB-like acyl-CoA dehydrogenase
VRFTPERQQFAEAVREFCRRECGTHAQREALTDGGRLSDSLDLLKKLASLGWLGISFPEQYGGGGAGFVDECIFLEETARGLLPIHAYGTGLTAAQTYLRFGSEDQKRTIVETLTSGRLEAIALSEPGAGSDLGGVRMRSVPDGGGWVLNGQKTWNTAGHLADHVLVLTRNDPSLGKHKGLTLLMVPLNATGLEVRPIATMEHAVNDLFFTDVRVPAEAVVGVVGEGWLQLMRGLAVERLIIAAGSVGSAQRALDDVIAFTTQREQFGRPVSSFQAVRHRIADLATEIAYCRAFVYDVADRIDAGEEAQLNREGSMAKLKCTEVAKLATLEAMQLMGGYGYASEYGMEGQVRRALAPPIYGGTNEIQREIIGKSLGL